MTLLRHSVVVRQIPREFARMFSDVLHDLVEGVRFDADGRAADQEAWPGLRLTSGAHLAPGATYEAENVRVTLTAWDRRRATAAEIRSHDEDGSSVSVIRLESADRLRRVTARGAYRGIGAYPRLRRFTWDAKADLNRWWDGGGSPPAITGKVVHPLARAAFTLGAVWHDPEHVRVTLAVRMRGRGLLRPLTALVLRLARKPLTEGFVEEVEEAAEEWNRGLPDLLRLTREDLTDSFLTRPRQLPPR